MEQKCFYKSLKATENPFSEKHFATGFNVVVEQQIKHDELFSFYFHLKILSCLIYEIKFFYGSEELVRLFECLGIE